MDFVFRLNACMQLFVHLNMKVLECVYVCVCVQVLLLVSVDIVLPQALDSCQATVAGSSALGGAATEQTLPHAYGFDKRHRSALILTRSESNQAKSQSV